MLTAISRAHIDVLRSIAKAGFAYESTKEAALAAHWQLTDDEFELGYLRFNVEILAGERALSLVVEFGMNSKPRFAFVGLFCFPDRDRYIAEFDAAFQSVAQGLDLAVGAPSASGQYGYEHRQWQYWYRWLSVPEAELVLVQDEFDIQDRFDVTLWICPAGKARKLPIWP